MAKLYFRYAAMNAGKSTALLQVAHNYAERGMKVMIFTAAIDHRSGFGYVRSRLGIKHEAALFGADSLFSRRNLPAGDRRDLAGGARRVPAARRVIPCRSCASPRRRIPRRTWRR